MIITKQPKRNIERKTTVYSNFKGVDFSLDAYLVDANRSPYAVNLLADIGGMPEKRLGYRTLHQESGEVNGLFYGDIDNQKVYIAHIGTNLYKWTKTTKTLIKQGIANKKSRAFFMRMPNDNGKIYIQTGEEYICYDGTNCVDVSTLAYIPTVIISRNPTGGGTVYDAVNLLSNKRIDSFLGNSTDTTYQLTANNLDSINKVEVMNASGNFVTVTSGFTTNLVSGQVVFEDPKPPIIEGQDNVRITYSKEVDGYADRINKCTINDLYGIGGDNRVFLSGNELYKGYDWYSEIYNPTYFPDINYSIVGTKDTGIMGYRKLGKYQVIIKETNQQDSTIFQRYGTLNDNGSVVFGLEQGVSGIGAISKECFVTLSDEPLFLSSEGIYAITTNNISLERVLRNRSHFVDFKLKAESNLSNSVACEWNGFYLLFVNGNVYVLDSKNKTYKGRSDVAGDFIYECYYWTDIPAVCVLSVANELYFGTEDGRICMFNTDIDNLTKYQDDGVAIRAIWSTKNDDDNLPHLYKTMQKKGCLVTIKPYTRSSAKVYISKDGDTDKLVKQENVDIFDFSDIDFERFTFNTNDTAKDIFIRTKVKKYKRLQIVVINDVINEGFGIFQIVKTYIVGNYAK